MHQKTILVIGAGASYEFGLPLGSQLISQVSDALDFRWEFGHKPIGKGDGYVLEALGRLAKNKGIERNEYTRALGKLRSGVQGFLSIDNYLHSHSDDTLLVEAGKIAIARSILAAEAKSVLYLDSRQDGRLSFDKISNTWLHPFIRLLNANVKVRDVDNIFNNLAIICFNYDRCLEHALYEFLQISFAITAEKAAECMRQLPIVHPYGVVGPLPWQSNNKSVPFGDYKRNDLETLSENIFLFTEQKNDADFNLFIDRHVPGAQKMMFLGFGYYRQNMDLIARELNDVVQIVGTAKGLSNADKKAVTDDIRNRYLVQKGPILNATLEDMTCVEMMNAYSRFLAPI